MDERRRPGQERDKEIKKLRRFSLEIQNIRERTLLGVKKRHIIGNKRRKAFQRSFYSRFLWQHKGRQFNRIKLLTSFLFVSKNNTIISGQEIVSEKPTNWPRKSCPLVIQFMKFSWAWNHRISWQACRKENHALAYGVSCFPVTSTSWE